MESLRQPIVLGSIGLYMTACIAIGLWAMRRTRSTRDFFVAGRDLGTVVTAVALFSSTMSGFGFVGGPGLVYALGLSSVWIVITAGAGAPMNDFLLGKRLRVFAGLGDSISLPDVVAMRYRSETTRLLTALAILLGVLGYLATQILAMSIVLQSLLPGDVSLVACAVIATSVLVFYCVTGGVIASVYTDLLQGSVMAVAGLLVFATAMFAVEGGPSAMVGAIAADDPAAIGPFGTLGIVACLSWFFLFAVGVTGQPHLMTKLMMVRSVRAYRWVGVINVAGYTLSALLWVSIGLAMRALVVSGSHPELATADAAAPEFLQGYAHPLLAGIVFAGLFAAIMSTGDAFLNIGAAALVHDIPCALRGRPLARELLWARAGTVVLAAVGMGFALYSHFVNERLVALLGVFGWGTFAAALVPTVTIGLNWKRATPLAASTAIAVSLAVNLGIELLNVRLPHGIHGGTLALLLSTLLFFAISLASPPPKLDPEVEAAMDI